MFLQRIRYLSGEQEKKKKGIKNPQLSSLRTARTRETITIELVLFMGFFFLLLLLFLPLLLPFPCLFVSASDELIGAGAD